MWVYLLASSAASVALSCSNACSNILVGIFSFFARRATVLVAIGLKLGGGKQLIIPHLRPRAIKNLAGVSEASSSYPESENSTKGGPLARQDVACRVARQYGYLEHP